MASRKPQHAAAGLAAIVFALTASLAVPRTTRAQDAPPSPAALVEEVEVIARLPGPALWRVSTPTSQLWILGLVESLPKGFQWDDRRLATALDGARELVLPPVATGGLGDALSILAYNRRELRLPSGETVRGDLPPALAGRWEAAARSIGRDPADYDHWQPVRAAMRLASDGKSHYGLVGNPMLRVIALAKDRRVKLRGLASYKVSDLLHAQAAAAPAEAAQECVALAAGMVERLPVDGPRAATAWATGDLNTLKATGATSGLGVCLDAAPAAAAFRDRAAADWAKELGNALASPGKTVVAVDLDNLTRKDGLLDQLKAQGLEVIGPAY